MNRREIGAYYEQKAADYLESEGYVIREKNYRCHVGEIDIIAQDGRYLVFVEVKYRKDKRQGGAFMAVDGRKQHRISRVAAYYLMENHRMDDCPCRFDVIAVDGEDIKLLKNAFEYC